ncbi:MAG: hypothetical protein Q9162_007893 [Coniocarpon cinnabarinum]
MFTNFGASNLQVVQYAGPPEKRPARPKSNKTGACTASASTQQLTTQCGEPIEAVCSGASVYKALRNTVTPEGSEPDSPVNPLPGADSWTSFKQIGQACALNSEDGSQTCPIEVSDDSDVDASSIPSLGELIHKRSPSSAAPADNLDARAPACDGDMDITVDSLAASLGRRCREPSTLLTQEKSLESAQGGDPPERSRSLLADAPRGTDGLALRGSSPACNDTDSRSPASAVEPASAHSDIRDDASGGGSGSIVVITNDWAGNNAQEWEVKRILDKRVTPSGGLEFKIRWGSTWEREENLHCPLLLKQFDQRRTQTRPNLPANRVRKFRHSAKTIARRSL